MEIETRRKIARQLGDHIHKHTHQYAVALIDFDSFELGSGTFVEIGTHTFVATAGHVLPPTINGRLFLLGSHPRKFSEGMPAYVNHATAYTKSVDVGFVEIDRAQTLPLLGKKALAIT